MNGNDQVIEVVITAKVTKDSDTCIVFGPKAYATNNPTTAIALAVQEAVNKGHTMDGSIEIRTRFFG